MSNVHFKKCFLILIKTLKYILLAIAAILFFYAKSIKKTKAKKALKEQEDLEFFETHKKWPLL